MPSPEQIARTAREELIAMEEAQRAELVRRMRLVEKRLAQSIRRLEKKIRNAQATGETLSPSWAFRIGNLEELLRQIQRLYTEAGAKEGPSIGRLQLDAAILAEASTAAASLSVSWSRLPLEALVQLQNRMADGSPLDERFLRVGVEAAEKAKQALFNGIVEGKNARVIARQIRTALQTTRFNAEVIARTEVTRAYREAQTLSYRENAELVSGWRWLAVKDDRTCPICLSLDGTLHDANEPFYSHPSCRCTTVPELKGGKALSQKIDGEEYFYSRDAKTQAKIVGPVRQKLLADKNLELKDLHTVRQDPRWGPTRVIKSFDSLVREGNVSRETITDAAAYVRKNGRNALEPARK